MSIKQSVDQLIGNTPLLRIGSLSALCGSNILVKCEFQNPGGSIKDRAALQMIDDGLASGALKPGMTVVEGTAGNTGIGLALVAAARGLKSLIVMPNDQSPQKMQLIQLHGAELKTVAPCPFANQQHFYHQARQIAEQNDQYWWANQFENTSNFRAHYLHTGPEIWQQLDGQVDTLVSVAGTGGTLAGTSHYLKQQNPDIEVWSVDPDGSGIFNFLQTGEYSNQGRSFTEGIGIMRLVENFKYAQIDYGVNLPDSHLLQIAEYVRHHDGLVLGSSSALNVAAAFMAGLQRPAGRNIVTFACDDGERSAAKLYNPAFLAERDVKPAFSGIDAMANYYRQATDQVARVDWVGKPYQG